MSLSTARDRDFDFEHVTPEHHREYEAQPRMTWLAQNPVPDVLHHRSTYLHTLNVVMESACRDEKPPTVENNLSVSWKTVHNKILVFWIKKRNALDTDHRRILWHLWARMHFALNRHKLELRRSATSRTVVDARLRIAREPVLQYTVSQLWRAVSVLLASWNAMRYSDEIKNYVEGLALQCGRYFWTTLPDRTVFNHPSYVTRVAAYEDMRVAGGRAVRQTQYCVNDAFIADTERIFAGLLDQIGEHKRLLKDATEVVEAPLPHSVRLFHKWVYKALETRSIAEGVTNDFTKALYNRRALIGEIERFAEKDAFGGDADANAAYNAIAKTRPQVITDTVDELDSQGFMSGLLADLKGWDDAEHGVGGYEGVVGAEAAAASASASAAASTSTETVAQVHARNVRESDTNELIIVAAGYLLDGAIESTQIRFSSWFVCTDPIIPRIRRKFPVIVRACNAWHVKFGTRVWLCKNSVQVLECWIRAMCANRDVLEAIKHVVPHGEPLFSAHRAITAEMSRAEHEEKRRRAARQTDTLMMPAGYSSDSDSSGAGEWTDGEDDEEEEEGGGGGSHFIRIL